MTPWEWIYVISTILILPIIVYALIAQSNVHTAFNRSKKLMNSSGLTGAQVAERLLAAAHIDARVERASGRGLVDHYDPKRKVVALSRDVYDGTSVGALGIAAHEVGHAIQDEENYAPLRIRNAIVPISNFASRWLLPLIIIGFIASIFAGAFENALMWILVPIIVIYFFATIVQIFTLPTEFNASTRAMKMLESIDVFANEDEKRHVRRVLSAAAQTYVAALAVTLVHLLRLLSIVAMMRR